MRNRASTAQHKYTHQFIARMNWNSSTTPDHHSSSARRPVTGVSSPRGVVAEAGQHTEMCVVEEVVEGGAVEEAGEEVVQPCVTIPSVTAAQQQLQEKEDQITRAPPDREGNQRRRRRHYTCIFLFSFLLLR